MNVKVLNHQFYHEKKNCHENQLQNDSTKIPLSPRLLGYGGKRILKMLNLLSVFLFKTLKVSSHSYHCHSSLL